MIEGSWKYLARTRLGKLGCRLAFAGIRKNIIQEGERDKRFKELYGLQKMHTDMTLFISYDNRTSDHPTKLISNRAGIKKNT